MAPCSPVSPPQAFLFNGSSRRVSAPPPAPLRCAHDKKRRSLLALSGSVKCRRRLSFAEELPPDPAELPPALRQLGHQLPSVRLAAWAQIAHALDASTPHPRLAHAILRPVLDVLHRASAVEIDAVAALLPNLLASLRASDQPDFSSQHTTILCAVMDAVSVLEQPTAALEHLLKVLRDEQCARVMPLQTVSRARTLLNCAVSLLRSADLELRLWPLLLHVVALVVDACERVQLDSAAFSLSRQQVTTILNCVDTMASRSADHTLGALEALKVIFSRRQVLLLFLQSDASAVIAEVSSLFADNVALQHKCVDLLACLSSPKLLTALDC